MSLSDLYRAKGLTDAVINDLLVLNVKPDEWFGEHGYTDQHVAGTFSDETGMLRWFFDKRKGETNRS